MVVQALGHLRASAGVNFAEALLVQRVIYLPHRTGGIAHRSWRTTLEQKGMAQGDLQFVALPGASSASIPATRGTAIPLRKLRHSAAILRGRFSLIQPENGDLAADPRESTLLRQSLLRSFQGAC